MPYADESVDEIRASHVLEHFPQAQLPAVIADWVRALTKGGKLKIAVPDFAKIAEGYLKGEARASRPSGICSAPRPTPTTSTRRCSTATSCASCWPVLAWF